MAERSVSTAAKFMSTTKAWLLASGGMDKMEIQDFLSPAVEILWEAIGAKKA